MSVKSVKMEISQQFQGIPSYKTFENIPTNLRMDVFRYLWECATNFRKAEAIMHVGLKFDESGGLRCYKDRFANVPKAATRTIFSFFTPLELISTVSRVCRKWQEIGFSDSVLQVVLHESNQEAEKRKYILNWCSGKSEAIYEVSDDIEKDLHMNLKPTEVFDKDMCDIYDSDDDDQVKQFKSLRPFEKMKIVNDAPEEYRSFFIDKLPSEMNTKFFAHSMPLVKVGSQPRGTPSYLKELSEQPEERAINVLQKMLLNYKKLANE